MTPASEPSGSAGADMPGARLRVLILEDRDTDAELMEHELRRGGFPIESRRASSESDYLRALSAFEPQLILADYMLPSFDGMSALLAARDARPDVPVVFVSGEIGEERAAEVCREGAFDYVRKQNLSRLVPAVRKALEQARERQRRRQAEEALLLSERRHRALLRINNAIIHSRDRAALCTTLLEALRDVVSFDRAELSILDAGGAALEVHALESPDASGPMTQLACPDDHLKPVLSGRVLFLPDLDAGGAGEDTACLRAQGIRSYAAVPLAGKRDVIGALSVASGRSGAFTEADAELLRAIGHQVALAAENTLAHEEIASLTRRLEMENGYLREEIKTTHNFEEIIGESPAIRKVQEAIRTVAPTEAMVLVTGETGTGKELVARAIHNLSGRRDKPLIKVNCAAIPRELFESEFFGHARGSFTGAHRDRAGRFELADGGTLFLDEVGEIPLELQGKLLRVLQEGEYERIGEERTRRSNVRVVAATNRDLEGEAENGRFRQDLYFRLSVFPIDVAPLRARQGDIVILARHFLDQAVRRLGVPPVALASRHLAELVSYSWPGNIRELQNVVERAAILFPSSHDLRFELPGARAGRSSKAGPRSLMTYEEIREHERENLLAALQRTNWKVAGPRGAAELLGVNATTLASRMKAMGIVRPS